MSATVVLDSKTSDDTKVVIRPDLKRNGNYKPSEEEISACAPCRMIAVVLFCLGLIGMLVAAIVIIAISPKCVPKTAPVPLAWWKKDQYYQIHVPSFQDSNKDGYGDVNGLSKRVHFLKEIGAKNVILSGVISSRGFKSTNSIVGSLSDFKKVVASLKSNDIKVLLSFNPTFTSADHPWFNSSRLSTSNKMRGYYIWQSTVANNWKNKNNNAAWEQDSISKEFYFSFYGKDSPMLNFRNGKVRDAMKSVLEFWMKEVGVSGFYLNAVERLTVDDKLRDSTLKVDYTKDQAESHKILNEWNKLATDHSAVLIGSPDSVTPESYYGTSSAKELHVVFNSYFASVRTPLTTATNINKTLNTYISGVPAFGWPGWTLGADMNSRIGTRFTEREAKLLNVMLMTLPGSVAPFYGNELLLKDVGSESVSIMQWSDKTSAGFSNATSPWLAVAADYKTNNVQVKSTVNSTFTIFRTLSKLRGKELSLAGPQFEVLYAASSSLVYYRSYKGFKSYVVALNFGTSATTGVSLAHDAMTLEKGLVIVDTEFLLTGKEKDLKSLQLGAGQGLVIEVTKQK